jgi:AAA family ATP:ADP antiporter
LSLPASTAVAAPPTRLLERFLSLFTEVPPGEAPRLSPSLAIARWVKTAKNSVDFSLMNTARRMLFLPTMREEKFNAKQVIDSFVVHTGDVLSALTIYAGTTFLALGASQFAWIKVGLVLVWLAFAVAIGGEFRRRTESVEESA